MNINGNGLLDKFKAKILANNIQKNPFHRPLLHGAVCFGSTNERIIPIKYENIPQKKQTLVILHMDFAPVFNKNRV